MASFAEWTEKEKKKKKQQAKGTSFTEYTKQVLGRDDIEAPLSEQEDDDIAPVVTTVNGDDTAPVMTVGTDDIEELENQLFKAQQRRTVLARSNTKKKEREELDETIKSLRKQINDRKIAAKTKADEEAGRTWFQKGAFEDGYQFGDVFRTVRGTGKDIGDNLWAGALGIAEKTVDAGAYIVGGVGGLFGADKFKDSTAEFIKKDIVNEEKVGKIASKIIGGNWIADAVVDKILSIPENTDDVSVLGEKSDALVQSGGQLAATYGLQLAGVPWFVTSGVTAFGGETENALNQGASYGAAGVSGLITAGAEILTEKLSGGIKFGGKALDDAAVKWLSQNITNKFYRTGLKLGLDFLGEGAEEWITEDISRFGQWLTYRSDEELQELLFSEEAMDAKIEAFLAGGILGGGMGGLNIVSSRASGRDYTSGMTANEEAVFNKEYENRIAEAEKDGKKLTNKEKNKIYDEVLTDMEEGGISTDTIEEVLGGDSYKAYKDTVDSEDALRKEYEELGNKQNPTLAEQTRYAELHEQIKGLESNSQRNQLKTQLSDTVYGMVQNDRLAESYYERGRRGQAFQADVTKYDEKQRAVVQSAIDSGILNNTNRTHKFVDILAKISADKGVPFNFTDNAKLKESGFAIEGKQVNGFVTKDGITLNIDSPKAWQSTVGHEVTHILEGTELYGELESAIVEYSKRKGDYDSRLAELTEIYKGIEDADVNKELVSDLVGDYLFTDADFVNHLSVNHRNVFQKIYDEIKYLCKVATAGSKELRQLEKVKKAFEDVYRGQKNTAIGGINYKLDYGDAIDQLSKGTLDRTKNTHLLVSEHTPQIFIDKAEAQDLKIIAGWDTAYLAMNKAGDIPGNYHGLGPDIMKAIPKALEDPLYIVKQSDGRINAITEVFVKGNRPALVSVELDAFSTPTMDGNQESENYNLIVTFFDAKSNYLQNKVFSGEIKYNKNNEAPAHFISRLKSLKKAVPTNDHAGTSTDGSKSQNAPVVKNQNSLSNNDTAPVRGNFSTPARDLKLETAPIREDVSAPVQEDAELSDVEKIVEGMMMSVEELRSLGITPEYDKLKETTDNGRMAEGKDAFGRKYWIQPKSDGTFVAIVEGEGSGFVANAFEKECSSFDEAYRSVWGYLASETPETYKAYIDDYNATHGVTAPVAVAESATTTPPADLADIAKQARRENFRGAYTHNGKQYLSDGSFVAEFNAVDESLEQSKDFPAKQALKELDEAYERRVPGNYDIHAADNGYIKVGNSLFDSKYVNAMLRAFDNPEFAVSNVRGGHEALLITGGNGRAVLMPVRAGDNVSVAYEAQPVAETAPVQEMFPDDLAPTDSYNALVERRDEILARVQEADIDTMLPEEIDALENEYREIEAKLAEMSSEADTMRQDGLDSMTDEDAPPETEAHYQTDSIAPDDPFYERDIGEVGKRSVKAYMYENPEVKPFFQEEARGMLSDLSGSMKGERTYIPVGLPGSYGLESYGHWTGNKRHTTDDIAYLLDECGYTYDEIRKGLEAIIEDNGAENNACSKRIEFMLNDRLMYGYKDVDGRPYPPNQDYINLLNEKQITEYSKEAFDALTDADAPPVDEIAPAPVAEEVAAEPTEDIGPVKETYEAIRPKPEKGPKLIRVDEVKGSTAKNAKGQQTILPESKQSNSAGQQTLFDEQAKVLTEEPNAKKNKGKAWSWVKEHIFDNGMVFEKLSLDTNNRKLQAKWNFIRGTQAMAQRFMGNGASGVRALNDVRQEVEKSGKEQEFSEYMYHLLNIDRMTLAERYQDMENKPVFGNGVTADMSMQTAAELEQANPEFQKWAQDIYTINTHLREKMVNSGIISRETADLWAEMYPHYVPIRRAGYEGAAINVALDTNRTGVNAPIKRATGGNRDILPMFDTIGQRTIQTYRAIAKNSFGVELANTLNTVIAKEKASVDGVIDSVENEEGLLKEGKNGKAPTFTVFVDGERVEFEITEEMYEALKPTTGILAETNKVLSGVNNFRRGLLTEYNPVFMTTNAIKDAQDILMNSQHPTRTYLALPKAVIEMARNGSFYREYLDNGGEQNTYFDGKTNTFTTEEKGVKKLLGIPPLSWISKANNIIERLPRLAEYIASRKAGQSIEVSMLDAARVTTNFQAGGDVTKFLNRNGATFLNASMQGAIQQVRNIREAKHNGLKGALGLAARVAIAGLPAMIFNHLMWDDDEEYEELSEYVKRDYYVVAKYGDGKFVRIPKGRMVSVIQNAFEQVGNAVNGEDVDLLGLGELVLSNIAPNNPLDNNVIAPIIQTATNKSWYGEEIVPSRLQDTPAAEQYDETTDAISKWLGETLNVSPYKINYLLDQYSGGLGDVVLPMLTPEAERGNDSFVGKAIAPFTDKFTTDSVLKNQNVSDFYDTKDKLATNANSIHATEEDVLKSKYMNAVNAELSELYKRKREIQSWNFPDSEKYNAVRKVQKKIDDLTKNALSSYENVEIDGKHAQIGNIQFRWYEPGEDSTTEPGWQKLTDKQIDKQNNVTRKLGISAGEYWNNKEEYDFAYDEPKKYAVAKSVGGYEAYKGYTKRLNKIKGVDYDGDGRSDSGTRKENVLDWINELDADYGTKIILFKSEYNADDTYNNDIVDYLNSRSDLSYEDTVTILKELGFEVDSKGNIYW